MEKPKINVNDLPWMECDCGGKVFDQMLMFKKISRLLTGAPKDEFMDVPVLICTSCKNVPKFVHEQFSDFPDNLKYSVAPKIIS